MRHFSSFISLAAQPLLTPAMHSFSRLVRSLSRLRETLYQGLCVIDVNTSRPPERSSTAHILGQTGLYSSSSLPYELHHSRSLRVTNLVIFCAPQQSEWARISVRLLQLSSLRFMGCYTCDTTNSWRSLLVALSMSEFLRTAFLRSYLGLLYFPHSPVHLGYRTTVIALVALHQHQNCPYILISKFWCNLECSF